MSSFKTKKVNFEAKIFKYPRIDYINPPGSKKGGYAGHNTQNQDIIIKFYDGLKDHEENIRDVLFGYLSRAKMSSKLERAIKIAEEESKHKILIDVDNETGKFIRINQKWLIDFFRKIRRNA